MIQSGQTADFKRILSADALSLLRSELAWGRNQQGNGSPRSEERSQNPIWTIGMAASREPGIDGACADILEELEASFPSLNGPYSWARWRCRSAGCYTALHQTPAVLLVLLQALDLPCGHSVD